MADPIDRQAAIDAINTSRTDATAKAKIRLLPSAQPKHGRWIAENSRPRSMIFYCSECKQIAYDAQGARGVPKRCRYHYCPNCGADMRGEQDE